MAFRPPPRTLAWAAPAIVSLLLSGATVGGRVAWQDSGFYLAAVRELGVLYPHGFVLFLLLAKAWSLLLFFVPFTLAVHLFSTACAAGAAAGLGVAARDLLRTDGPLFKVSPQDPGETTASWIGAAVGSLAAAGYTFWSAAIYAKSYAFLYLVLAWLLRSMIRADQAPSRRAFNVVALLIGLAWQAHPSAALLGGALVLFLAARRSAIGARGLLIGVGLAAAVALGPSLLLPILASRDTAVAFGEPTTVREWLPYLTASRFTSVPDAFGIDETRVRSVALFLWEEALGASLLMVIGIVRLARANRRLLLGLATWVVPQLGVTVLFKLEGQHDHWFVASWLVLWLAAAVGLAALVERRAALVRPVAAAVAALGVAWSAAANLPDLRLRGYDLAETFGRIHLLRPEKNAVLILISDDATAITRYLQVVEGVRRDVLVLHETELEEGMSGEPSFYLKRAQRAEPGLRIPDFAAARAKAPGVLGTFPGVCAFLNANADRPIYLQLAPASTSLLRDDLALAPVGALQKLVRRGEEPRDPDRWTLPMEPSDVRLRRARGQIVNAGPAGIRVRPEPYEHRLLAALSKARRAEADHLVRNGTYDRAETIYTMLREVDPSSRGDRSLALALVACKIRLGRGAEGHDLLEAVLRSDPPPDVRAEALCLRGEFLRSQGRKADAEASFREALAPPGLDPRKREDIERRAKGP